MSDSPPAAVGYDRRMDMQILPKSLMRRAARTMRGALRARIGRVCALLAPLLLAACVPHGGVAERPDTAVVPKATESARILVFTRTAGFRHDSIPVAVDTLRALASEAGFSVEQSEDPALFRDDALWRYRAVVFASTTGDVLDAEQQVAFERYVRKGGGYVGVHAAADTEYDWPWYGELVGAWFVGHPPGLQDTGVTFEGDAAQASAQPWRVTDELYNYKRNPRSFVEVIATVDERDYNGGTMGSDHPIAWCHARFSGRAWYTGLGHTEAMYADPTYRAHLLRGLRYVTRRADDC
jgi:type 1 glutamine amidotransferase